MVFSIQSDFPPALPGGAGGAGGGMGGMGGAGLKILEFYGSFQLVAPLCQLN